MKKGFFIFLLFISFNAFASNFYVCKSTYALCTTAKCAQIKNKENLASCKCNVKTGYSVGTQPCEEVQKIKEGELIFSRYYPIKGYVKCSNNRPWAWCLDKPCLIDKKDSSKANCACSIVANKGDYIIVADTYTKSTCTTGLYSSATVSDANQITDFLKGQSELPPFDIKVYKAN